MEIRRAQTHDANRLLELWVELSEAGQEADQRYRIKPDATEAMVEAIEFWLTDDQPTWVAEVDGKPAGFIVAKPAPPHPVLDTPSTLVVTDAYVSASFRRNGIGSALFDVVSDYAQGAGIDVIEVGTLALDERAIDFWRSHGFGEWRVTMSRQLSASKTQPTR